ncbi:hypothetical protein CAI21_05530 [Alkalilimnicola ehrlichii]|uniref:Uncharacterized protein n=1 Tax=Alkalilimnicola ehrlichii TaxID=351052 RepID=A0A3E0WZ20_9GAMM|nr:DUF6763 family protein [Alkalilimnicola ehrlichii]RFA30508.1 hypothetical protein CAI21_05530 [Alkalilimnicola ehrlichii]RFA38058.1 hypothetical protein CAL65_06900 [Alkalilimnicola ehrlichii]
MTTHLEPEKGRWYHDLNAKRDFQVVWLDDEGTLVEAQFTDGHKEQFPLAAWLDLNLEPTESPEESGLKGDTYRVGSDWGDRLPPDAQNY